jgi:hypothetical protein
MAGLLDIFGTSGADTMGLLGMSPEDIQKNRSDAQAQALYALAGRLFQGGRGGASIVEGLQQGQQAYKTAMQGNLQQQLQNAQVQEMLRKRQQEQAALAEQQRIQNVIKGAVTQPQEIYGEDIMGQRVGEGMTAPSFDLQRALPQLMTTPESRKTLTDLIGAKKAMGGETTTLAEGAKLIRVNPITGKVETVAEGAPKPEVMPNSLREFMVAQQNPAYAKFLETQTAAKAPKLAVDLKDPTAIAKAQADILKDWRGVVKDGGAMEVADRFKAAKAAVAEGNAGNKAADGALIYAIGKIYDPSGAVQEGDKATILGNRSIPQSIQAYAQRALNGQSLLPEERAGLLAVASKVVESKARNLEAQKAPYANISQQLGGNGTLLLNPLADALTAPVERPVNMPSLADIQAEIARRRKP